MNDYLEVEYDVKRKPLTKYPRKLAYHIINLFDLKPGDKILEIGSGRCEILQHFAEFGLKTYAIDSAPSAQEYANKIGSSFEILEISSEKEIEPFDGQKFDFIYSKSFVEHISDPLDFGLKCKNILNSNGKFIVLTPDFESNYKIFYDDITHIKPFTRISLYQKLELVGFEDIKVKKFRQLPSTWNSRAMLFISIICGKFAHHRVKLKWFRWSRELMLMGVGTKK